MAAAEMPKSHHKGLFFDLFSYITGSSFFTFYYDYLSLTFWELNIL